MDTEKFPIVQLFDSDFCAYSIHFSFCVACYSGIAIHGVMIHGVVFPLVALSGPNVEPQRASAENAFNRIQSILHCMLIVPIQCSIFGRTYCFQCSMRITRYIIINEFYPLTVLSFVPFYGVVFHRSISSGSLASVCPMNSTIERFAPILVHHLPCKYLRG